MAERSNVLPWKGSVGEISPGVRIPLSPQFERSEKLRREAMHLNALRGGFEKVEPAARSEASTARNLY